MDGRMSLGLAVKATEEPVVIYCRGERAEAVKQPGGYHTCSVCGRIVKVVA